MLRREERRVSLQVPKKKKKKWERKKVWNDICETFKRHGLFIETSNDYGTQNSNPYHIQTVEENSFLIHKFNPLLGDVWKGKSNAVQLYETLVDDYNRKNVAVIDPLPNVLRVINRFTLHEALRSSSLSDYVSGETGERVRLPRTAMIQKSDDVARRRRLLAAADIKFPCIYKPLIANGEEKSHQLVIVMDEDGLADVRGPGVIQQFIRHLPVLYKLFVIDRQSFLVHRSSIRNVSDENREKWGSKFTFDSRQISSFDSRQQTSSESSDLIVSMPTKSVRVKNEPSDGLLAKIRELLTDDLGISLFGVDLIRGAGGGDDAAMGASSSSSSSSAATFFIIDVNFFPGYEGIPDFSEKLAQHVLYYARNPRQIPSSRYGGDDGPPSRYDNAAAPSSRYHSDGAPSSRFHGSNNDDASSPPPQMIKATTATG